MIAAIAVALALFPAVAIAPSIAGREGGVALQQVEASTDDPDHPIPYLDRIDVYAEKADGAVLVVVIASPLGDDKRSLERLMSKFEGYLGFINSADYAKAHGAPSPATAEIHVSIDRGSSPAAFGLLEASRPWIEENHASLTVEIQD